MKYIITIEDDPEEEGAVLMTVEPPFKRGHATPAEVAAYIGFKAIEEVTPRVLDDLANATELFQA